MNKTWKPIVAGILEILAGFWMLVSAVTLFKVFLYGVVYWKPTSLFDLILFIAALLFLIFPLTAVLFGIASLVGGVCALLRRRWGLAFAGAIATVPLFSMGSGLLRDLLMDFAGITNLNLSTLISMIILFILSAAIITLIILSKREFAS